MSQLTGQQSLAVRTRAASVVLSSGAGCGKTHVLTQRYLSHLREDGAEVGQIVAITFTDRAARQMRGRIRASLTRLLREAPEDEAPRWAGHLRDLEAAPISTIHAFCGNLLRQHAVEAGLDPAFDVLEEVLAVNLRGEALARCLQGLLVARHEVGDDLRELILLYGWRTVVESVEALLPAHDERGWGDWLNKSPSQIAEGWIDFAQTELLPRHLGHLIASRPAIAGVLEFLATHPPQPGPMSDPVALLLREIPLLPCAEDLPAAVERLTQAAKVGRAGAKAWPDATVYERVKSAFEDFREDLRSLGLERFAAEAQDVASAAQTGQRFLRVASAAVRAYREKKRASAVVDFQDLLTLARDLLLDNDAVRARLQDRFRFLLIDELQDVDPVQMELVALLAGSGLACGKLFAVGDHKQSIYRFRGADVSRFQDLRKRMPAEGRQGLTINFRSQPAIIDFANALLCTSLEDYEPLVAHQPQVMPGACVEFLWSPRPEKASAAQARAVEADGIARRLAAMIGREPLVVDEQSGELRAVRAGDVVLLFRAMSNVHLYEAALRRCGLDYYLVGGRAFFAQQEVFDVCNLLRAMENPHDAVSLAGTLRSPFFCLSDEALFVIGRNRGGLWAGLFDEASETALPRDQLDRVRRARTNLAHWRQQKDRLPIAELLDLVISTSGYDAALRLEFLGERKLANLWKLTELARAFDRTGLFGLAEFVARLDDLVVSQPREEQAASQPENADVVRLMTIHQAKGLEFPVVVLPDFGAETGSALSPPVAWDARLGCVPRPPSDEDVPPFPEFAWRAYRAAEELQEWHEDLRTLYVACTRPRDYLVLSAALQPGQAARGPWMQALCRRFDPASGACLAADVPADRRPLVRVADVPPEPMPRERSASIPGIPPEVRPLPSLPAEVVPLAEVERRLDAGSLFAGASFREEDDPSSRLLRRVLDRWDFRDADGWRGPLRRLAGETPLEEIERLGRVLERFARAPIGQSLREAKAVRRRLEFVARPGDVAVCGVIDCAMQDNAGRWTLLFWLTQPVAASGRAEAWSRRLAALSLASSAWQQQTGAWPHAAGLVFVHEAEALLRPASRLPHRSVAERL